MNELHGDMNYSIWSERCVIADCLEQLGKRDLAKKVHKPETSGELIKEFLHIIEREATATKRHDVLEQLYFAGLVYG